MKSRIILQVMVEVEHHDGADLDEIVSGFDYSFTSMVDWSTVTDTEIQEVINLFPCTEG